MDLQELRFVVKTEQLVEAADKLKALGTEVQKLNKPLTEMANSTDKVTKAIDKSNQAAEKKVKADDDAGKSASKLEKLLEKLNNRYADMANGSTSAEAGVLQLARSLGATTENALKPYKTALENIRELSKSPFDSAIGSVRSITQEYESMTNRAQLAAKGIFLTTNQLKEYSKIASEIKGKLKAADMDPTKGEGLSKFNSELKAQQDIYLGIANKVNTMKAAEKDRNEILNIQMKEMARLQEASDNLFKYNQLRHAQDQQGYKSDMADMKAYYSQLEKTANRVVKSGSPKQQAGMMDQTVTMFYKEQAKATNEAAKANEYLEKAMHREVQLMTSSAEVTSTMNNKLIAFENNLRKSGKTAAEQAIELDKFRKALEANQKVSGNRQVDYLSRALGPQITDITVGLATGQNPLTVMLQQGGQLRDQFALAGVAGKDMGKMLEVAAKSMVTSVRDVTVAVGGLIVSMAASPITALWNRKKEIDEISAKLSDSSISQLRANRLIEVANGRLIQSFITIGTVGAAAFGVTLLVAIKEVIDQEAALSKALALTGGSLGINQNQALGLAQAYAGAKGNVGSFVEAITEVAKAGGVTSNNLETVAKTIVEVSRVTGISAQDLAKNFSKFAEKPTEALIPFARELGTINVEILKQVHSLELSGKYAEAATLATNEYSKALRKATEEMKADMGVFEHIFYGIGSAAKSMWDSILNIGRKGTLQEQMKEATAALIEAQQGKAWYSRFGRTNEEEIAYYQEIVQSIGKQINAQKALGEEKAKNSADALKFDKQLKDSGDKSVNMPKDLALEALKKQYADQNKMIDSEFNKQQSINKSNFALGLTREGAYLSNELTLIEGQNAAKLEANDKYYVDLLRARRTQEDKINAEFGRAKGAAKTPKEVEALEKQRAAAIESTKAAYDNLTEGVKANNEVLDDNLVKSTAEAMERLGSTTKVAFENIGSGANLSTMFDGALAGAGRFLTAIEDIGKSQERTAAAYSDNLKVNGHDLVKFGKMQERIATVSSYEQMKSYGDMIGGLKSYAKQGSKTYKALENAEKVYRVFQLAMSLKAAAANLMEGQTAAAAGVANQAKGDPYTAFPRMAAMAAIMATIGFAVGMTGGSDGPDASNMGTGTVFGDSTAKSESLTKSLEILNDTELLALNYSQQMAKSLSNIESNITGFTNLLIRSSGLSNLTGNIPTGKFDTKLSGAMNIGANALESVIGKNIVSGFLKSINTALFGKSISITGSGITAGSQTLGNISNTGFQGSYYANVQEKSKFLGLTYDTSGSTRTNALDPAIERQITTILTGVGDAVKAGALALGNSIESINKDLSNYVVSLGDIDLQGLNGEAIAEKLNNVFGAEADNIAQAIIPGLESLQKVGEGYFETLTRAATQLEYVNLQTERLNANYSLIGIQGAKAADSLIELFGSLSNFQSSISDYYQNFYTEEERNARTLQELTTAFENMGLALPKTIEDYRSLVNQQNLYSESGQQVYTNLVKLSSAFSTVTKASNEATAAAKTQADAAADAAKKALDSAKDILRKSGESISDWLKKLLPSTLSTPSQNLNSARSQYLKDLTLSQVSDQTALGNVTTSAQAYLDAAKNASTTSAQYRLAIAQVATQVAALPAVKSWNDEVLLKLDLIAFYTKSTSLSSNDTSSTTLNNYQQLVKTLNTLGIISDTTAKDYLKSIDSYTSLGLIDKNTKAAAMTSAEDYKTNIESLQKLGIISATDADLYTSSSNLNKISNSIADNTLNNYLQAIKSLNELGLISDYTSDAYIEAVKAQGTLGLINYNTDGTESALIKSLTELGLIKSGTDNTATNTNKTATSADEQIKQLVSLQKEGLGSVYNAIAGSYKFYDTMNLNLTEIGKVLEGIRTAGGGSSSGGGFFTKVGSAAGSVIDTGVSTVKKITSLFSDARIKENISLYKTLPNGINLYDFNYKAPYSSILGTDMKRGVLAQEVEKMYPNAVSENSQGIKKVDYSKLPIPSDLIKFAKGGSFTNGIVSAPTLFNTAVMGEAGPEAIMPLNKLPDGSLGVRAVSSGNSADNAMLWQAIDRLNANVDGLRAETRATVVNTSKTAKLLDRVVESDTIKVQTVTI